MTIRPPEIAYTYEDGLEYKPSWKRDALFINQEHAQIYEQMQHLPGWQDPQDSQKLYEMAYYNGSIILEIGVYGGRSAAVELRGALAARSGAMPQYYGLDIDPGFLVRSQPSVAFAGAGEQCLFYHGNLQQFLGDLPIVPTMVFVDGDHEYPGCAADLRTLSTVLAPGTPVLCHDYHAIQGVRRAVDELISTPFFRLMGLFAGGALLQATDACPGRPRCLCPDSFQRTRRALLDRYLTALANGDQAGQHTPVEDLVKEARAELTDRSRGASGRAAWPWSTPDTSALPAVLPDGKPWPKISVITPSFNQGNYIEETLLSVANQNYPNIEHIVIDGGSTDNTVAILQKHAARLAYWVSEKDRGQSNAINKGFARATGEIVTWLNSDDLLAPGALAAVALAFQQSGADLVAGICQLHRDGEIIDQHLTSCADGPLPLEELADIENRWFSGQFFYQPEVLFKRDLLLKVGGGLNEQMFWNLDYDLWFRFAQVGAQLKVIGRPVALYRVHDEQKTHDEEGFKKELRQHVARLRPNQPIPPAVLPPALRQLRVALLTDVGFRYGAGIGHERIARSLRLAGHEVIPIAIAQDNLSEEQKALPFQAQILPRLQKESPDVVVVGNVHAAGLGAEDLRAIADVLPTVFVAHDIWLLTGRCAYCAGCEKNLTGCDETCPTPTEYPPLSPTAIRPAWERKMALLRDSPHLTLAANSHWTLAQIQRVATALQATPNSPVRRTHVIRYGVPTEIFRPRDQAVCREMLGLPRDKFILLFSCSNLADQRKGMSHLVAAIRKLNLPDLVPVCIGYNDGRNQPDLPGIVAVGYVTDPHRQAMLYSAADIFVAPSLEEAFGQVFIEAAACGTPSVAYPVDGVPEAVKNGTSGRLAAAVTPSELAAAIEDLYWNPNLRRDLGAWARIWVENEFSPAAGTHSLTFALRSALRLAGIDLMPKIQLTSRLTAIPAPAVLFAELGYTAPPRQPASPQTLARDLTGVLPPTEKQLEQAMLEYYEDRLAAYRNRRSTPWFLRPRAWLARINRNALRKAVARKK